MKWFSPILAALLFMVLPHANAAAASVSLYEWHTPQTMRPLILAVKANESPEMAAARYVRGLIREPDMMELFQGRAPDLSQGEFKPFGNSENAASRALIMANAPKDYTKNSTRLENFITNLAESGTTSYILPICANLGLTRKETQQLFKLLANEFPLLILLGGDDVTTRLYKQKDFHARDTIPLRDQFEIAFIQAYVKEGKGFLFAVCRGMQITAVALGYKLVQDIIFHIKNAIAHADDWHGIKLLKTSFGMLREAVKGFKDLTVNSLHHQFVVFKEGGPLELAAVGPDGITEALESKDGRIFLTQWHPELMDNALGKAILKSVVARKNLLYTNRCQQSFDF